MPFFLTIKSKTETRRYPLSDKTITIGRANEATIQIQDVKSSRLHLKIFFQQPHYFVEDLKSSNGTLLNQKPLQKIHPLTLGDELQIGQLRFLFTQTRDSSSFVAQSLAQERYKVMENLGEGGMGVVQLVFDHWLEREIALKRIRFESSTILSEQQKLMRWRLQREALITSSLGHPNIIPLHDIQRESNGDLSFTMRKVEGETLRTLLLQKRDGKKDYDEDQILSIFLKVCDAVAYAHNQGVIHRDLKPDNIMVGKFGEVYVMDWGIAKEFKLSASKPQGEEKLSVNQKPESLEPFHTIGGIGTPGYMAPEQGEDANKVKPQADIYALGKILRQCFLNLAPHEEFNFLINLNKSQRKLERGKIQKQVTFLDQKLPPEILAITNKATHESWEERYQFVQELVADIERYLQNVRVSSKEYSFWDLLRKWSRRYQKTFLLWIGLFLFCGFLFFSFQWQQHQEKKSHFQSFWNQAQEKLAALPENFSRKEENSLGILLQGFYFLDRALQINPTSFEVQQEKFNTGKMLIELACENNNYPLAGYVLERLNELAPWLKEDTNLLREQLSKARATLLDENQKEFNRALNKLAASPLKEQEIDRLVVEISRMKSNEIFEELCLFLPKATQYFLSVEKPNPLKKQFYYSLLRSLGRLGNPKTAKTILDSLEQMAQKLTAFPPGQLPTAALDYMVLLGNILGNTKAIEAIKPFQKIRIAMGEHSQFWDRTLLSYYKLHQLQPKKATPDILEPNWKEYSQQEAKYYLYRGLFKRKKGFLEEALLDFDQALKLNVTYALAYYHRAELYLQQEDFAKALLDYNFALKLNPYFIEGFSQRGALKEKLGKRKAALQDYNQALQLKPDSLSLYWARGLLHLQLKEYKLAQTDFDEVLFLKKQNSVSFYAYDFEKRNSSPTDMFIYLVLGKTNYFLGFLSEASLRFHQVLKIDPVNSEALFFLGNLHFQKEEFVTAGQFYQQLLEMDPKHLAANFQQGLVYEKLKQWEKALLHYQNALKMYPKNATLYFLQGQLHHRLKNYEKALSDYDQSILYEPKQDKIYIKRAQLREKENDLLGAIADYSYFLDQKTKVSIADKVLAFSSRGKLYLKKGSFKKAITDFDNACLLEPKNASLYCNRGKAKAENGELAAALKDYQYSLKFNPKLAETYFLRGGLFEVDKKIELARDDYLQAIKIAPSAKYYTALGQLEIKAGELDVALKYLNAALQLNTKFADAFYYRGVLKEKKGKLKEALENYNQVLVWDPKNLRAYLQRGKLNELNKNVLAAIKDYEAILNQEPEHFEAFQRLISLKGIESEKKEDLEKSLLDYNKVIEKNPKKAANYLARGIIQRKLGALRKAVADYNLCLEQDPKSSVAYFQRGLIKSEWGKKESALKDYNQAIQLDIQFAEAYFQRGRLQKEKGKLKAALEDLNSASRHGLRGFLFNKEMAYLLQELKEWESALKYVGIALEIRKEDPELLNLKGWLLLQLENIGEAIESFEIALKFDPHFCEAHENLGLAYQAYGDFTKAKNAFSKAIEIKSSPTAYRFRGLILKEEGKFQEAIQDMNQAVARSAQFSEAYNDLGILKYCEGDFSGALKASNKAIHINSKFSLAFYYRALIYKVYGKKKLGKVLENYEQAIRHHLGTSVAFLDKENSRQLKGKLKELDAQLAKELPQIDLFAVRAHLYKRLKNYRKALWNYEVFFHLSPDFAQFYHPFHSPKLSIPAFRYSGTKIYQCKNIARRVHEYKHKKTQLEFSLIPDGVFYMGSTLGEIDRINKLREHDHSDNEGVRHLVFIRSFLMAKTELTQAVWNKIMPSADNYFEGEVSIKKGPEYPMVRLQWDQVKQFCKRENFDLPTESQWEYAYRAGSDTSYYWGDVMDEKYCWHNQSDTLGSFRKVKETRLPNAFGLFDMSGNVSEWCEDTYHLKYTVEKPNDGTAWTGKKIHVFRGGGYNNNEYQCRAAYRDAVAPEDGTPHRGIFLGFRVCKTLYH